MSIFSKILVPIDFSSCSINALRVGARLCQKDGSLTVLNVYHPGTVVSGSLVEGGIKEDLIAKLSKIGQEMKELSGIDIQYQVELGLAGDLIPDLAARNEYSMIVMGTKGEHDVIDKLIGSVANKIMQSAEIPVLVVPENAEYHDLKKIVFAADFHEIKDLSVLDYIRDLALAFDAELHLLNVTLSPDAISEEEGQHALELHEYFFDVNHGFFFSKEKDVKKGLLSYMKENNADILAMMPRKHSFLADLFHKSTTEDVSLNLDVPLFSFHE